MFKTRLFSFTSINVFCLLLAFTSINAVSANLDPTRPFGASGFSSSAKIKSEGGLSLTSIIHGDGIHTAVINGKIYKMFDYVGEYRITAINSHSVILRSETKRLKINVFDRSGFKSQVVKNTVVK